MGSDVEIARNLPHVVMFFIPIVGSIAVFSFLAVAAWSNARRKEREAYYRSETLKKIAESSGEGARSALELLREQEKNANKRRLEGMKLGGLINIALGIGFAVFLHGVAREESAYLLGVIPLLIGSVLLLYALFLAPKETMPNDKA